MSSIWTALTGAKESEKDDGYPRLEELVRGRVAGLGKEPLFTTDAEGLFAAYLESLPPERRQHYNCHACRSFLDKFGGLTWINEEGEAYPVLWDEYQVPEFFAQAVGEVRRRVSAAKVTGVFYSSEKVWGRPETPDPKRGVAWTHLAAVNPYLFAHPLKNASQVVAERREDFKMILGALDDYPQGVVEEAVRVLSADALTRSEKALGVAEWFLGLHQAVKSTSDSRRSRNIVWRAVATAPPGFAHVRSTVISTLLSDIVAGLPYESVRRRWAEKLHPLQYQRPSAAPSEGAIDQAEKAFEKLGAGRSLLRRYASLADVLVKLWVPQPPLVEEQKESGGLFSHLRSGSQEIKRLELPSKVMTWEKFRATILPGCKILEVQVPAHGNFYGLVTAEDPESPPILQWDGLAGYPRNPVSWYVYNGGSSSANWMAGWTHPVSTWIKATAVFPGPSEWQEPEKFTHQSQRICFALEGCRDASWERSGLGIFPECLKAEYHAFRAVIEAHSRKGKISDYETGNANGLLLQRGDNALLTVRADGIVYTLDRWE